MTLIGRNIPEDFLIQVSQGLIPNHSLVTVSGRNSDVDTTITDIGTRDIIFPWLTVATTVQAVSSDISDTAAGNGAQIITVEGLDGSFDLVSEDIVMDGTNVTASTTASFIRINRTFVKDAGLYATTPEGANVGIIIVQPTGGGTALSTIDNDLIDPGKSQDFKYTVPNGHTAIIISGAANIEGNKLARVVFTIRPNADDVSAPFSSKVSTAFIAGASGLHILPKDLLTIVLAAKTDLWASGIAQAQNTEISAQARLLLIKN